MFQSHCCNTLVPLLRLLHLPSSPLAIFVDIQFLVFSANKPHVDGLSTQRLNLTNLDRTVMVAALLPGDIVHKLLLNTWFDVGALCV